MITPPLLALLVLLLCLGIGALIYWAVVLYRIARTDRTITGLGAGLAPSAERSWPSLAVVVPAHNERDHIARLARSLAEQDYAGELRIAFVLDRCTDDTRAVLDEAVAASARPDVFTIIENDSCPPGWSGKTHAVHRGVADSRAHESDLLLFTDADCWLDPRALRAAVALLAKERVAILSLLPTLTADRWWEKTAQVAAGMELIRRFPLDEVNRVEKPRRFANGQFMLFRADAYRQLGGHQAVKDALLEDLAFARKAGSIDVGTRRRVGVTMADALVRCRMYETIDEFRRGWKRIYSEAAYANPDRLAKDARRLVATGIVLPLGALACLGASAVPLLAGNGGLAYAMQGVGWASVLLVVTSLARVYATQRVSPPWLVAYPVGAWIVAGILREAAHDARTNAPTRWGGITYARREGTSHEAVGRTISREDAPS